MSGWVQRLSLWVALSVCVSGCATLGTMTGYRHTAWLRVGASSQEISPWTEYVLGAPLSSPRSLHVGTPDELVVVEYPFTKDQALAFYYSENELVLIHPRGAEQGFLTHRELIAKTKDPTPMPVSSAGKGSALTGYLVSNSPSRTKPQITAIMGRTT